MGFAKWLDQIEHSIASDDHGEDITSVEKLIKQHEEILCEIEAKRKPINEYIVKATELQTVCENEIVKEHMSHADSILQRYESLEEPCQIRADNLKDSLKFFQWTAVADEQIGWINDKIPQLESTNYGQTLHSAQSMKKKHDIFEQVCL